MLSVSGVRGVLVALLTAFLFRVLWLPFSRQPRRRWSKYLFYSNVVHTWLISAIAVHLPVLVLDDAGGLTGAAVYASTVPASLLGALIAVPIVTTVTRRYLRVDFGRSWLELQLSVLSVCAGNFLFLSPLSARSGFTFPLAVICASAGDIVAIASLAAAGVAFHGRFSRDKEDGHRNREERVGDAGRTAVGNNEPVRRSRRLALRSDAGVEHSRLEISDGGIGGDGCDGTIDEGEVVVEHPGEDMVPWYSSFIGKTAFALVLTEGVFASRFDPRALNAARRGGDVEVIDLRSGGDGSDGRGGGGDYGDDISSPVGDCGGSESDDDAVLWFDFTADVGDGFNSSYEVARLLAQPTLLVTSRGDGSQVALPRGSALVLGGDLAYPGPTEATYRDRFMYPFECALPGSGSRVDVDKLVGACGAGSTGGGTDGIECEIDDENDAVVARGRGAHGSGGDGTASRRRARSRSSSAPRRGSAAEKRKESRAVRVPRVARELAAWLSSPGSGGRGDEVELAAKKSRGTAIRKKKRGGAGAGAGGNDGERDTRPVLLTCPGNHDAIDGLATYSHFLLRGSVGGWRMPQRDTYWASRLPLGWWIFGLDTGITGDIDRDQLRYFALLARHAVAPDHAVIVVTHEPVWLKEHMHRAAVDPDLRDGDLEPNVDVLMGLLGPRLRARFAGDVHNYQRHTRVPGLRPETGGEGPEHLITCGTGGAFLHPTHGPFPGSINLRPKRGAHFSHHHHHHHHHHQEEEEGRAGTRAETTKTRVARAAALNRKAQVAQAAQSTQAAQTHVRRSSFPDPARSESLTLRNVLLFRSLNWRFDVVSGFLYVFLAFSCGVPLCGQLGRLRARAADCRAHFVPDAGDRLSATDLVACVAPAFAAEVASSVAGLAVAGWVQVIVIAALVAFAVGVAGAGAGNAEHEGDEHGDGTDSNSCGACCGDECDSRCASSGSSRGWGIALRRRLSKYGGPWWGVVHVVTHIVAAVALVTATEAMLERMIETGGLVTVMNGGGAAGGTPTSVFTRLASVMTDAVAPVVQGNSAASRLPGAIATAMRFVDVPEWGMAVRREICEGSRVSPVDLVAFYASASAYFFVVSVPVAALIFGVYLFLSLNAWGMHWNEAFSSLQVEDYKGFVRLKIRRDGDIEAWVVGVERVPRGWVRSRNSTEVSPSVWEPAPGEGSDPFIVDRFTIKR